MPWDVKLIQVPTINDFRSDFFPRRYHYKRNALDLVAEVERKGGKAVVEKAVKERKKKS